MKKYLNPQYDVIFVILGKGCNMKCKYCLQAPYHRKEVESKDLPLVADFIRDAAENQKSPLTVQFFGGEPLLYMQDMKKLVRVLKDIPNIHFSFISNGSLLTEDLVDYFNEHDFWCCFSWDGPRSNEIRGLDVMELKKPLFMKINKLGLSAIISAYCYPMQMLDAYAEFNEEYQALRGTNVNMTIEEFLDTGIDNCQELLANKEILQQQMTEMVQHYARSLEGKEHKWQYASFIGQNVQIIRDSLSRDTMMGSFSRCGDGSRVVNLDLQGNLYKCHNNEVRIGTVHDPFWAMLDKSILADNALPHRAECYQCHVAPLCLGGCALIQDQHRQAMCELHLALYTPIVNFVLERVK